MVKSTDPPDNSLLNKVGQCTDEGDQTHTDHHILLRYYCHPVEIYDEECLENCAKGEHCDKRNNSSPDAIVTSNNPKISEGTKHDSQ